MSKKLFSRLVSALKAESFAFFLMSKSMYSLLTLISPSEAVWNLKNYHQLAFGIIKSDWDIVRGYRLFSCIDMILNRPANTYFGYWESLENFSARSKCTLRVGSNTFFGVSKSKFASERVWNLKNRHQLAFGIIKSDWGIVRGHRLFSWIDMILSKPTNTYFGYW